MYGGAEVSEYFVCPTHCFALVRQVNELSDEHVQQDPQVIGEEVLLRAGGGEEEIEDLEDEQLHTQVL